jgi:hypothetical protein
MAFDIGTRYGGRLAGAYWRAISEQDTANHTGSFRHEEYKNNTELSKNVWKLKSENSQYTTKWSIMKKVKAYKPGTKRCNLCLEEKLLIMKAKKTECLNKRSDLFSKCRHVTRYLLHQVVK